MTADRGAARQRLWLFGATVLVLGGLLTHGTHAGSGDAPHYLAIAHSLAFDHDLDLSNNYGAAEPLIGSGELRPEFHVGHGAGDVIRPVHDIGMPLLFAPAVRVIVPAVSWLAPRIPAFLMQRLRLAPSVLYRNLMAVIMILLAGLLATLMFDTFVAIGSPPATAFWTALFVALSPPLMIYAILFFTELLSAFLCLIAFRRIAIDEGPASLSGWAFTGAATGMLLLVHVRNAALVAALAAIAIHELWRRGAVRDLVAFAASLSTLLIARTAVNHRMWGTWVTNPHARPGEWHGWSSMMTAAAMRLAGMLFDQEYGLLPYAPVFVLAAFGLIVLARARPALAVRVSAVAGCYVLTVMLPITNAHGWTGGWSPAGRFLVPTVPLLAICLVAAMRTAPRLILVPILLVRVAIDAYMWQHPNDLWNDGDGVAAVCSSGGASFCAYLPSFAGSQ